MNSAKKLDEAINVFLTALEEFELEALDKENEQIHALKDKRGENMSVTHITTLKKTSVVFNRTMHVLHQLQANPLLKNYFGLSSITYPTLEEQMND